MFQPDQILQVGPFPQTAAGALGRRYQLLTQLSLGEGRQTWQALDLEASPPVLVALKLVAFGQAVGWQGLRLFEREVNTVRSLSHPQLPSYHDSFSVEHEGETWWGLAQSYIPGSSLRQLLAEGECFDEAKLRWIATQVLEVLAYLHRAQPPILHRDLKPSNLIWGTDGRVSVIDLGSVQIQPSVMGESFSVVGTYGYAPMEQFGGRAVPASDLYALGMTLMHLLTGLEPAELPRQAIAPLPPTLSPGFGQWLRVMTQADVLRRYGSAAEALRALEERALEERALGERALEEEVLPQTETTHPRSRIARSYPSATQKHPPSSPVQIQRSPNHFRLELPGDDLGHVIAGLGVVFLGGSLWVSPLLVLLALPLGSLGLWLSAAYVLRLERLADDGDRIQLRLYRTMLGQVLQHKQERHAQITRLFHNLRPQKNQRLDLHQSNRTFVIQTRRRTYLLRTTLNCAESAWLLQELQAWIETPSGDCLPLPSSGNSSSRVMASLLPKEAAI